MDFLSNSRWQNRKEREGVSDTLVREKLLEILEGIGEGGGV